MEFVRQARDSLRQSKDKFCRSELVPCEIRITLQRARGSGNLTYQSSTHSRAFRRFLDVVCCGAVGCVVACGTPLCCAWSCDLSAGAEPESSGGRVPPSRLNNVNVARRPSSMRTKRRP